MVIFLRFPPNAMMIMKLSTLILVFVRSHVSRLYGLRPSVHVQTVNIYFHVTVRVTSSSPLRGLSVYGFVSLLKLAPASANIIFHFCSAVNSLISHKKHMLFF